MKKRIPTFLAGMATMALIGGLSVSALAATGQMTITVDPINIQVNGTTFAPKDAQGNSVPVFSYNGTTYAPLRALAEAYGLNVGYDSKNNMATVSSEAASTETPTPSPSQTPDNTASTDYSDWSKEEEAAYQEFKGLWEVTAAPTADTKVLRLRCYKLVTAGESASEASRIGETAVDTFLSSNTVEFVEKCCIRFDCELYQQYETPEILYGFSLYGTWGWPDRLSDGAFKCGYRDYLETTVIP